jgi:NADPH-dependent F420 reductase
VNDKPVISLIGGTGNEGKGLALRWAKAGYRIIIGSRKAERAEEAAAALKEILPEAAVQGMDNNRAVREGEIAVLTVVQSAHMAALESLKDELQGKILVDATARISFPNPRPPEKPSAGRIAQEFLGEGVEVVTAFQNVPAHALVELEKPIASDVLVCADNREPAEKVIALAREAGMDAYYVGDLDLAITVEGLTAILVHLNMRNKVKNASIKITGIK